RDGPGTTRAARGEGCPRDRGRDLREDHRSSRRPPYLIRAEDLRDMRGLSPPGEKARRETVSRMSHGPHSSVLPLPPPLPDPPIRRYPASLGPAAGRSDPA